MGSEGSKSKSCDKYVAGGALGDRGFRADCAEANNVCGEGRFTHCAVWSRALNNKAGHEAMRIPVEILTLGLAAIARKTAGNCDHWAFVAKCEDAKGCAGPVYFIAQFGSGVIIPSLDEIKKFKRDITLTGYVATSLEDATAIMCDSERNRKVWIKSPRTKSWQYPHSGKAPEPCVVDEPSNWTAMHQAYTLEAINNLIYLSRCKCDYDVLSNNCQHFAEDMYTMATKEEAQPKAEEAAAEAQRKEEPEAQPKAEEAAAEAQRKEEPFDLQAELASRVGMESLKKQVLDFQHALVIDQRRREANPDFPRAPFPHMLFRGPPGCGKTSMARLIAKALKSMGVLSRGHLVEVQRPDLVALYIGHTASKTKKVIDSARGGVLFVDECYRLSAPGENDFGHEAIDELMSAMDDGDPVFIFAGYDEPVMDNFVASNSGLFRRIHQVFTFNNYSPRELAEILLIKFAKNGFSLAPPLQGDPDRIAQLLDDHSSEQQREQMNGGMCDHVLRNAKQRLDARLSADSPVEDLYTFCEDDLVGACSDLPILQPL